MAQAVGRGWRRRGASGVRAPRSREPGREAEPYPEAVADPSGGALDQARSFLDFPTFYLESSDFIRIAPGRYEDHRTSQDLLGPPGTSQGLPRTS